MSEVLKSSKRNPQICLKKCDSNPDPPKQIDMVIEEGPFALGSLVIKKKVHHRRLSGIPSRTNGKYKACDLCGILITTAHISRHKRLHCRIGKHLPKSPLRFQNSGNFICEYCQNKFSTLASKRRHLLLVHKLNLISKASQLRPTSGHPNIAKETGQVAKERWAGGFRTKRTSYSRRPTDLLPQIFKCEHCTLKFTTDGNRRRHLINKHKGKLISKASLKSNRNYKACEYCGILITEAHISRHRNVYCKMKDSHISIREKESRKVRAAPLKKVKVCKENTVACEYCESQITEHNLKRHLLFSCKAKKRGTSSRLIIKGKAKEANGVSEIIVKAEEDQVETEQVEIVDVCETLVSREHMEEEVEVPDEDPLEI